MDDSNMFTVTPMSNKIALDAGDTYEGDIIVANPANATSDFAYKVTVSAYNVKGEDYVADFLNDTERSQIVDWIKIDNPTGVLKPNETVKVHYKVSVPSSAPAGGQYAAFLISSDAKDTASDGFSVKNIFEMASILYAQINGEIVRDGKLLSNEVPGFVTKVPIEVASSYQNDGNVHETARISLEVRNFISSSVIYPESGESGTVEEVIMPGTTRRVTRNIEGLSPLGLYKVSQTINYMGSTSIESKVIVACPIWFMVLVLVTITAIVVTFIQAAKHRRKKKQVF